MLPPLVLPLTLLYSLLAAPAVLAGDVPWLQACNPAHQKLQEGTYQFQTDCDAMTYCASNSTCALRGCRSDDFPFGYSSNVTIPDKCPKGMFCPDEQDSCQALLSVGSACQFNRDDECEGPPNFKELADTTGFGLNVNGSICLNNVCMWANVTVGLPCVVQNTAYTAYGPDGEFVDIVSRELRLEVIENDTRLCQVGACAQTRDHGVYGIRREGSMREVLMKYAYRGNCKVGLYCDAQQLVCVQTKAIGETCDADKECSTYNCLADGTCGRTTDTPVKVGVWVYIVVAICIFGGMIGTLIALYFVHRKDRTAEHEKRLQYWREQNAFRQNILQMQETARHSLMSYTPGGSPRSSQMIPSEDSVGPMTHGANKASALRYYVSDDGSQMDDRSDEDLMMRKRDPNPGRF
ncbi:hypothetical protein L226DRAFT_457878 [Lentinus tigrinus ALCF2SS1-7]|uniref:uncharacterized protein n=1 Tax=Lentinus tigrinus ALCF2SS1-7 TaxID=1328758 RepID=UPI001165C9F9|nr:hypothetical protein L226DRAFT_457878 [Lentinus tigrinus ALCF2SS1-7]